MCCVDAAGLALGDVRLADRIEERRLAVVDVTHDRHDRGPRLLRFGGFLGRLVLHLDRRLGVERHVLDRVLEFLRDQRRGIEIELFA